MKYLGLTALTLGLAMSIAPVAHAAPGDISTVAGNGISGYTGDNVPATSTRLSTPFAAALDPVGTLYIADFNSRRIRKVDATTQILTTVAGIGTGGFSGDGGPATAAQFDKPYDVALDAAGNFYIADDNNHRIRKVSAATGIITTVAGSATSGFSGDNGLATNARLNQPKSIALDGAGNLYIADNQNDRIRKVAARTGIITTFAGSAIAGFGGDGGPATEARLNSPARIAFDAAGNLFITDSGNHRIRKVAVGTGIITTVAGSDTSGFSGDGGAATDAELSFPNGIALDGGGNLFIADQNNNRVRKVDAVTNIITTVAGTGTAGDSGDGAAATSAELDHPRGLALDAAGNLHVADGGNHRIRKIEQIGVPVSPQPDNHIGTRRGRQRGDNRHNLSGSGQTIRAISRRGRRVNLFFTAENDANVGNATGSDALRLRATRKDRNFTIKYFQLTPVRRNVTAAATRGKLNTGSLFPGAGATFTARIKPKKGIRRTKVLKITSTSQSNPAKRDTVKARVKAKK